MLEPVVQVGHILIAASTLLGMLLSAVGIYYGLKSTLQSLTYKMGSIEGRLLDVEAEMKRQTDIRLVQHEHEIRLNHLEKTQDSHGKHLDTLDTRQNNAQASMSELRLNKAWGEITKT